MFSLLDTCHSDARGHSPSSDDTPPYPICTDSNSIQYHSHTARVAASSSSSTPSAPAWRQPASHNTTLSTILPTAVWPKLSGRDVVSKSFGGHVAVEVGVGSEVVGSEVVGGIAGGVGHGGMGRTRVGNGGIAGIAGVVNRIVDAIEAGYWEQTASREQVVGPEEVVVAKSLSIDVSSIKKCNAIDDSTIALHPIDTSATTMTTTTTNNDKRNNDTDIETYVVFSPLFPTLTLTTRGRLTATANNCLTNSSPRRPQRQRRHAHTQCG